MGGNCLWGILTVADRSDHADDNEPQEHASSVAQEQDKDQTDRHGHNQTTATTQTHAYWELTGVWQVKKLIWSLRIHSVRGFENRNVSGAI